MFPVGGSTHLNFDRTVINRQHKLLLHYVVKILNTIKHLTQSNFQPYFQIAHISKLEKNPCVNDFMCTVGLALSSDQFQNYRSNFNLKEFYYSLSLSQTISKKLTIKNQLNNVLQYKLHMISLL